MRITVWYSPDLQKNQRAFAVGPKVFVLAVGVITAWIVTGPNIRLSVTPGNWSSTQAQLSSRF